MPNRASRPQWFSKIAVLCLLFSLAAVSIRAAETETQPRASTKPNIILVMADDQGWGEMGYNGHPTVKTPNFDEAASSGLQFDNFYAAAPVCSPTRASVMTGRHPNRMGVFQWGYPMRPQEVTLAEALKKSGYTTGHFGKWHLGSVRRSSPANPGRNGFDHWVSAPNFYDNDPILSHQGTAVQESGESSMVAVDAALDWLDEVKQNDHPFLAVVWFGSPHSPHQAVEQDRALYEDQPKAMQHFLGEITGMDRAFGKLRNRLSEMGLRDNTILWYCSDNGALPKVGTTGGYRGNKGSLYEGGLRVPAILEWPAVVDKHRVLKTRCNTSDIYPTLLEITDTEIADQPPLDGISLLPLIKGADPVRSKPMGFWNFPTRGIGTPSAQWMSELLKAQQDGGDLPPHQASQQAAELPAPPYATDSFPGHAAWIEADWKLHRVQNPQGKIRWELYDLASDPYEQSDLAKQQPSRVKEMKEPFQAWLVSVTESLNGKDYRK